MARRGAFALFFFALMAGYPAFMPISRQAKAQRKVEPKPTSTNPAPRVTSSDRASAQRWMRGMTLREKIGQLIMIASYGEAPSSRSNAYRDFVTSVRDLKVGGIIVINRVVQGSVRNAEPYAMASFLNRMQRLAKVPLLVGADFERGASMRVANTPKYPHQMAFGAARDLSLTRKFGSLTANEARALGVHWVFAPVADVNNNPDNPIINVRSFGENPADVAANVRAFIEGAHSDPSRRVLVTVKHFPGHGDTATDSHMALPSLGADKARMDGLELVPFREAIAAGVDAVMTAHMAVPAIEPEEIPATVSSKVLTGLLRKELAFPGLIVTDALDMQGVAKQFSAGESGVRALEAGADLLLMPTNPEAVVKATLAAIREGRLSEKRINDSVMRLLMAKARVGLQKNKLVDLEDISDVTDSAEANEFAQTVADRALTMVKNESSLLPIKNPAGACVWILSESRYGQQGRTLIQEIRNRAAGIRVQLLDPQVSTIEIDEILQKTGACDVHVVNAFVTVAAYRGNVALNGNHPAFMEKIQASKAPIAMIALGNPYLLRSFPTVMSYLATFSTAQTAEIAAAKAIFGEVAINGKLPVTIPGLAKYGEGLSIPRK